MLKEDPSHKKPLSAEAFVSIITGSQTEEATWFKVGARSGVSLLLVLEGQRMGLLKRSTESNGEHLGEWF